MSTGFLLFPVGYAPTDNGAVIPNGKLTFSRTGTSTLQNTYSDSALSVPNANPVVLNAEGFLDTKVYGDPTTGFKYRVKLTDANDVETGFGTVDDVTVNIDASTLDGIDSSDFARLSQSNTFAGTDQVITAGAATAARWRLAGNGTTPGTTSFDVLQDTDSTAVLQQRANAAMRFLVNGAERLSIAADGGLVVSGLTNYADDAAAASGGVPVGGLYRTASAVKVRVS